MSERTDFLLKRVCVDFPLFTQPLQYLEKLLIHDFIAAKQSRFLIDLKESLLPGEIIVIMDFAENYSFVVQDAIQAFHWNNNQATLFPVIVYIKENNELKHFCFVFISDCLKHDSISVYMFQRQLIQCLKEKFDKIDKIFYMSDGAPQQFKNKKAFANLCSHYTDYNIKAEWHFFATAHGKGPCDGIAGTTKRLAYRASLQKGVHKPILNPKDLFEWAQDTIKNISFIYVDNAVYEETELFLKERFSKSMTVKGTLTYHAMIPIVDQIEYANVKKFSSSDVCKKVKILK